MTEMNPEVKARWLAALTSGEYTQGRDLLAREVAPGVFRYCCLGVLCELAYADGVIARTLDFDRYYYHDVGVDRGITPAKCYATQLPPTVVTWAGLPNGNPIVASVDLATHNDGSVTVGAEHSRRSFAEIAELIRRHL